MFKPFLTLNSFLGARGKRKRDDKAPEKIQKVTENGNAPSPKKNMVSFGDSSTKSQIEKIDDSPERQRYLLFLFKSNDHTGIEGICVKVYFISY